MRLDALRSAACRHVIAASRRRSVHLHIQRRYAVASTEAKPASRLLPTSAKREGDHLDDESPAKQPEIIRNQAGVQLLSRSLHEQVFGVKPSFPPLDPTAIAISKLHLERNGLAKKESPVLPTTEFTLPQLQGSNIEEHFYNLGVAHSEPYLHLSKGLANAKVPKQPDYWAAVSGWVRYEADGSYEPVPYPAEHALVFDVETMYKISPFAVMATAVSPTHWYSWTSAWLLGESDNPEQLISLPGKVPTLLVGHNVGYDRARIQEEYHLERTQNRFMDTMSLHAAVTGLSSHQRAPWMKHKKNKRLAMAKRMAEQGMPDDNGSDSNGSMSPRWEDLSSMNSLADVAKLHCGIEVDKSARDWFGSEDKQEILTEFQDLMTYCANDVAITQKVFAAVLPAFLKACPNPVTFAGVLHMGNSFLPVDESWEQFVERAESLYQKLTIGVDQELFKLAEQARKLIFANGPDGRPIYETDPWLQQLDWTPKKARKLPIPVPQAQDDQPHPALLGSQDTIAEIAAEGDTATQPVSTDGTEQQPATTTDEPLAELPPQPKPQDPSPPPITLSEQQIGEASSGPVPADESATEAPAVPTWFTHLWQPRYKHITRAAWDTMVPLLLKMTWHGFPLYYDKAHGWIYSVAKRRKHDPEGLEVESDLVPKSQRAFTLKKVTTRTLFTARSASQFEKEILASPYDLTLDICKLAPGSKSTSLDSPEAISLGEKVVDLAKTYCNKSKKEVAKDRWLSQLDWTEVEVEEESQSSAEETANFIDGSPNSTSDNPIANEKQGKKEAGKGAPAVVDLTETVWPQWYWDMHRPKAGEQGINLSIRSKAAPLLLRLKWQGHELFHSRQHAWLYRMTNEAWQKRLAEEEDAANAQWPVKFTHAADMALQDDKDHVYFKLPHKDGSDSNVGSPLSKTFIPAFEDGTLSSEYPAAAAALEMNAQCSYWISARERVMKQLVVWRSETHKRGFPEDSPHEKHGMILPQVVTMGTVTRRAVESTWLAASNAKKNRLGSELKAMIRAPPGYSIVGADVDSEELWICCVMGDAQFGVHGATAIGWMTLEGTKSAGTDLHSKTASILGISRDKAKVFNYSRIYGAGVKHAVQLLLQANPKLSRDAANNLAKSLYASTKGLKQHTTNNPFKRKFWYGGTESHVFNTLEAIAMANDPRTPALGCGITTALAKDNLPATERSKAGEDFMPSRINWVVQSSGVDYLHLLIVSMEYLTRRFNIDARFMISVHDEIRYLVKEKDRYRAALALQVSNLWTRALFSYRLQMESLPQSCAWFSAVDIDHVLRKEVNMDCITPSQPTPIPHGVSQDILQTLEHTNNGSLFEDGSSMSFDERTLRLDSRSDGGADTPSAITYRARDNSFLEAQNALNKRTLEQIMADKVNTVDWDAIAQIGQHFKLPEETKRPRKVAAKSQEQELQPVLKFRPAPPATERKPRATTTRKVQAPAPPPITGLPLRRAGRGQI